MLCPESSGETDLLDDVPRLLPQSPHGTWRPPAVYMMSDWWAIQCCCLGGQVYLFLKSKVWKPLFLGTALPFSCNQILRRPLNLVQITSEELWQRAPPAGPVPYGARHCGPGGADGGPQCRRLCRLSPPGFQGMPSVNQTQRKAERKGPR